MADKVLVFPPLPRREVRALLCCNAKGNSWLRHLEGNQSPLSSPEQVTPGCRRVFPGTPSSGPLFASGQTICPCWLCLGHGVYGFSLRSGLSPSPNVVLPSKKLQSASGQVRNCKHQDCMVLPNGCHRVVAVFLGRPSRLIRLLCIRMHITKVGVTTACCWCELHWRVTA